MGQRCSARVDTIPVRNARSKPTHAGARAASDIALTVPGAGARSFESVLLPPSLSHHRHHRRFSVHARVCPVGRLFGQRGDNTLAYILVHDA